MQGYPICPRTIGKNPGPVPTSTVFSILSSHAEAYLKTHLSTQQGALCRKALPGHSRCMLLIHRQQPVTLHLEWHGGRSFAFTLSTANLPMPFHEKIVSIAKLPQINPLKFVAISVHTRKNCIAQRMSHYAAP